MLNAKQIEPGDAPVAIGQEAFDAATQSHERYARGAGGARISLRFADARGLDGRRRVLNDGDFTGADLRSGQFAGAHFERAALYCADLRRCDLRASNLRRADLRGARFSGASLNGAMLDEADMRAAYLAVSDSQGRIRFHGPGAANDNPAADFSNCSLRGAHLRNANLKGADFSGAILDGADLKGAKLSGALFNGAVLTGMPVDQLPLSAEQLKGCVLDPGADQLARLPALAAILSQAAEWVESGGKRGAPAVLDGEDLRPLLSAFRARTLTALSARNARAIRVDFAGCELQGAVFDGADLRGAVFDGADLRGASFRGANLSHASLDRADLGALTLPNGKAFNPDFAGACLDRTDFSHTVLKRNAPAAQPAAEAMTA